MNAKSTPTSSTQADPATDAPARESQNDSNAMWGGRFSQAPDSLMEAINVSIGFDKRLYAQDIVGSIAHCKMLVDQKILLSLIHI